MQATGQIFVTAGYIVRWDRQNLFVIAGFISTYFTVILPGFQVFFGITGGVFLIAGFHCVKYRASGHNCSLKITVPGVILGSIYGT